MLCPYDRVLVAISCSSSSLALLHVIRQFARARNIVVEIGACSIGAPGVDPRALMLYLRDLGVRYHYEESEYLRVSGEFKELFKNGSNFRSNGELEGEIGICGEEVQLQRAGHGNDVG